MNSRPSDATVEIERAYDSVVSAWRAADPLDRLQMLDGFAVRFAYNSGKIENDEITYHDTREVFDRDGVTSYTGSLRTLFEIRNQKTAWEWALACVDRGFSWNSAQVRDAHRLLTYGTYDQDRWAKGERPGSYKLGDYVVGVDDVGFPAASVKDAVDELVAQVSEAADESAANRNALTIASFFHAQFIEIHPFADGNGRTARLVSNMLLLSLGHPPLVVREENRLAYFGALDAFHAEGDLDALKRFFQVETIATWHGASASNLLP